MTLERLAEIESRADAVRTACSPAVQQKRIRQSQADIPELIAEVKRLRAELDDFESEDDYTRCAVLPAVASGITESSLTTIATIRGGNHG